MSSDVIHTSGAKALAVGAASAEIISTMLPGKLYLFSTNIACWVKQGPTTTVTAVAGAADNVLLIPVEIYYFHGSNGNALAVIQDAAGGKASICPLDKC